MSKQFLKIGQEVDLKVRAVSFSHVFIKRPMTLTVTELHEDHFVGISTYDGEKIRATYDRIETIDGMRLDRYVV